MPTPAPLLAGGRVLGTAHRHAVVPARNADVAAYAFAYLVVPPLVDFIRQKWVRDARSRTPDQIKDGLAAAVGRTSGGCAVGAAGVHLALPTIRALGQQGHHLMRLGSGI